jgi:gas vesicle protein
MADRFDNNEGGGFVLGLLTGTVLGMGLGMLFAPKAGSELRDQLSEQAGALANQAQDGYRKVTQNAGQWAEKGKETAGEWAERGKDMYGKVRDAVSRGAEEAENSVREATGISPGATTAPATAGGVGSSPSTNPSSYGSSRSTHKTAPGSSYADSLSGTGGGTTGGGEGPRRS